MMFFPRFVTKIIAFELGLCDCNVCKEVPRLKSWAKLEVEGGSGGVDLKKTLQENLHGSA